MTRIVPVALALVAILAFGGCSGGGETGESQTVTVTSESPSTAPSTDAPASADAGAQRNPGGASVEYGLYERVSFPAGSSGTTISAGTATGTVNGYVLEARAGQVMTVSIASVESNAVFEVYAPDDSRLLGEGDRVFLLPTDGDYLIIVSATRGNSSYELTIDIADSSGISPDG